MTSTPPVRSVARQPHLRRLAAARLRLWPCLQTSGATTLRRIVNAKGD